MTLTPLSRRRGARRAAGALFATIVAGGSMIATAGAANADESTPKVQSFDTSEFAEAAADLPQGLVDAVQRDLGLNAEEYLANAAAAKVSADVVAGLKANGVGVVDAEVAGQDLTIYVESDADVKAAKATGAKVEVGAPAPRDAAGREYQALADVKGGYGWATFDESGSGNRCSVGFNGTAADGSPLFLTAGHCIDGYPEGQETFHFSQDGPLYDGDLNQDTLTSLGTTGTGQFGGGNDGALNPINAEGWTALPEVAFWGGGEGAPDDGNAVPIYDSTDAVVGQPACKSGATTGWTCGEVTAAEETVDVGHPDGGTVEVTGFTMDTCMLQGDSGGSTVSGNYALGVNSFGESHANNSTCDGWKEAGKFSGSFAVTSGTANAEQQFGDAFNLSISVGAPAVSAPEDGAETTPTPTIEGKAAAAKGATVSVAIDGGPTVEGTVDANGNWSAKVDEALAEGDYAYTATTSHTAKGASAATASEATSGTFSVTEPATEPVMIDAPTDDQTTGDARPSFSGTGHPGAALMLTIGDDTFGEGAVGDDGKWTIKPSKDLPIGKRFDATVAQEAEGETQTDTVTGLGVKAPGITIAVPADGSEVEGDVVFTGAVFPGSEVALEIEGTVSAQAATVQANAEAKADQWKGKFEVDKKGNWTFTPDEPLENGEYTLTAKASVPDGDEKLTSSEASTSFSVVDNAGGDDDGGDDLPDTGSSNTLPMILIGAGLVAAGGTFVGVRALRSRSVA